MLSSKNHICRVFTDVNSSMTSIQTWKIIKCNISEKITGFISGLPTPWPMTADNYLPGGYSLTVAVLAGPDKQGIAMLDPGECVVLDVIATTWGLWSHSYAFVGSSVNREGATEVIILTMSSGVVVNHSAIGGLSLHRYPSVFSLPTKHCSFMRRGLLEALRSFALQRGINLMITYTNQPFFLQINRPTLRDATNPTYVVLSAIYWYLRIK
jgi:hypothetical protein